MKIGIAIQPTGKSLKTKRFQDGFHGLALQGTMVLWRESPEIEALISLGIPFLFVGGAQLTGRLLYRAAVIDVDKKYIGVVKTVSREIVYPQDFGSFYDLRIDHVRTRAGLPHHQTDYEKLCSNERKFYLYRVNAHLDQTL